MALGSLISASAVPHRGEEGRGRERKTILYREQTRSEEEEERQYCIANRLDRKKRKKDHIISRTDQIGRRERKTIIISRTDQIGRRGRKTILYREQTRSEEEEKRQHYISNTLDGKKRKKDNIISRIDRQKRKKDNIISRTDQIGRRGRKNIFYQAYIAKRSEEEEERQYYIVNTLDGKKRKKDNIMSRTYRQKDNITSRTARQTSPADGKVRTAFSTGRNRLIPPHAVVFY